jgi:hypothetical protein
MMDPPYLSSASSTTIYLIEPIHRQHRFIPLGDSIPNSKKMRWSLEITEPNLLHISSSHSLPPPTSLALAASALSSSNLVTE